MNWWPSSDEDGAAHPVAWASLADYALKHDSSRYRLFLFPYNPRPDPDDLYRARIRMVNVPGAMFIVSWLLEDFCGVDFLSTSGIDALDECGIADSIIHARRDRLVGKVARDEDDLALLICEIRERLEAECSDAKRIKNLGDAAKLSEFANACLAKCGFTTAADVTPVLFKAAAEKWNSYLRILAGRGKDGVDAHSWKLLPRFAPGPLAAAPYRVLHSGAKKPLQRLRNHKNARDPIVRVEKCFSADDQSAMRKLTGSYRFFSSPIVSWPEDAPIQLDDRWLAALLPGSALDPIIACLPTETTPFTYANIALDFTSGTISVHFKSRSEAIRRVRVNWRRTGVTEPSVADFSLQLFRQSFDLRTIAQRSPDHSSIEFSANVVGSRLALDALDDRLAEAVLRRWTLRAEDRMPTVVEVNSPCYLAPTQAVLGVHCACDGNMACSLDGQYVGETCRRQQNSVAANGSNYADSQFLGFRAITAKLMANSTVTGLFTGIGSDADYTNGILGDQYDTAGLRVCTALNSMQHALHELPGGPISFRANVNARLSQLLFPVDRVGRPQSKATTAEHPVAKKGTISRAIIPDSPDDAFTVKWKDRLTHGMNGELWLVDTEYALTLPHYHKVDSWLLKVVSEDKFKKELPLYGKLDKLLDVCPLMRPILVLSEGGRNDCAGLVVERLDGYDLEKAMAKKGHRHWLPDIIDWLSSVAVMIKRWREESLIHLDIKPGNIFRLHADGALRLLDVGLISECGSSGAEWHRRLRNDKDATWWQVFGSRYHVAPEILFREGSDLTSHETPIYSWGALACHLLGDERAVTQISDPAPSPALPRWATEIFGNVFASTIASCLERRGQDRPRIDELVTTCASVKRALS